MLIDEDKMREVIKSAGVDDDPNSLKMQATKDRMLFLARKAARTMSGYRMMGIGACLLVGVSAVGLAATETGRNLVRWVFTPVETRHYIFHEPEKIDSSSITPVSYVTGRDQSPTEVEEEIIKSEIDEIERIRQNGGGKLIGLLEGPEQEGIYPVYRIEYTLGNGKTLAVNWNKPEGKQAENMRIDEIMKLRDSGAGEVISKEYSRLGMGKYILRFDMPDGRTVDLETYYPPGTREEREAIFAETRLLKEQRRFKVLKASRDPDGKILGLLQYTLFDGRPIGINEHDLPEDIISIDGQYVVMPETQAQE